MAPTRKQQQKNIRPNETSHTQSHTQKFKTVDSETMLEQDEPKRKDSNASRANLGEVLREKEREDNRHSGIPIGSDPRE